MATNKQKQAYKSTLRWAKSNVDPSIDLILADDDPRPAARRRQAERAKLKRKGVK